MPCTSLCLVTDKINPYAVEINKSTQFVPLANAYSPTKTLCSIASLISGNRSSKLFRTTSTIINQANGNAKDWLLIRRGAYHVTKVSFSRQISRWRLWHSRSWFASAPRFFIETPLFEFSPYASFPLNRLLTEWLVSYTGCSFQGWKFVQREARCDGRLEMRKGRHELWSHGGWISTGEGFLH